MRARICACIFPRSNSISRSARSRCYHAPRVSVIERQPFATRDGRRGKRGGDQPPYVESRGKEGGGAYLFQIVFRFFSDASLRGRGEILIRGEADKFSTDKREASPRRKSRSTRRSSSFSRTSPTDTRARSGSGAARSASRSLNDFSRCFAVAPCAKLKSTRRAEIARGFPHFAAADFAHVQRKVLFCWFLSSLLAKLRAFALLATVRSSSSLRE